jgi:Cu2+-containing amine oxidase
MAMMQLDEVGAQNQELQKQLDAANLSLMEGREQRILDWNKFNVQEQDKMALETMKLQQTGVTDAAKLQLDAAKVMQQAENDQVKAMNESDKLMFDLQHRADEAEKRGYEQGVRDMTPRGEE